MKRKNLEIMTLNPHSYSNRKLIEEAQHAGLSVVCANPFYLSTSECGPEVAEVPDYVIHRSSGVLRDSYDLLVSRGLKAMGAKLINDPDCIEVFRSKASQLLWLKSHELAHVRSYIHRGPINEASVRNMSSALGEGGAYMVKTFWGNGGKGVFKISHFDELCGVLETQFYQKDQNFLIQPFVKAEKECRVMFVGGEILGAIEKTGTQVKKNHQYKTSAKFISLGQLDQSLRSLAESVMRTSKLSYGAIDFIFDGSCPLILEVNSMPSFEHWEECSAQNVASMIISLLC
ncbi:MAG: hypothetical protein HOE90_10905 [Bacteriovoracaceae bacterium]|nr:hypothetical protein [Bacteriovoracaceae bacterium]